MRNAENHDEYIVVGGSGKAPIIKFDHNGNKIWEKNLPSFGIYRDVASVYNNGFVAVGYANGALIRFFDFDGNLEWEKAFNVNHTQVLYSVVVTGDENILAVGQTPAHSMFLGHKGGYDALVVQFDLNGNSKSFNPDNGENEYNAILNEINQLNDEVDNGHVTLELIPEYFSQVDVLRQRVNDLPEHQSKDELHNLLDEIEEKLLLLDIVLRIGNGEFQGIDFEDVQKQVDKLQESKLKDQLQEQLEKGKLIKDAVEKVEQAEKTKKRKDVDSARDAVNQLPDGELKDRLKHRLDAIVVADDNEFDKLFKDAEKKLKQAELMKREPYITKAQEAINQLPESAEKDYLQQRLDALLQAIEEAEYQKLLKDAERKVKQAETYERDPYISNAQKAINELPDGEDKYALQARLDAIKESLGDHDSNLNEIDKIQDPVVKDIFLRIERAVQRAEKYLARSFIIHALNLLEEVPQEERSHPDYALIYENLNARAQAVKDEYNSGLESKALEEAVKKAERAIETYKKHQTAYYYSRAQIAIESIGDESIREMLQERLDEIMSEEENS